MHESIPGVTTPPGNLPDRPFTGVGNLPFIISCTCTGAGYCSLRRCMLCTLESQDGKVSLCNFYILQLYIRYYRPFKYGGQKRNYFLGANSTRETETSHKDGVHCYLLDDCNSNRAIPFNIHTPYGREFLRGFEKSVSEGLCASASFDLCVFSEG